MKPFLKAARPRSLDTSQRRWPSRPSSFWVGERRSFGRHCRNGTRGLVAALNVATWDVLAPCKARHRSADFVTFLRDIDANVDSALEIHEVHRDGEVARDMACDALTDSSLDGTFDQEIDVESGRH